VAVLAEGMKAMGQHAVTFRPDAALPTGVYVYRLWVDGHGASRTVVHAR